MQKQAGHSDSDSDEDDEVDEKEIKKVSDSKKNRQGVSAEVYGEFNKKENFIARVIQKTPQQKQRIIARLENSFMFTALDEKE